jgi:alginate O-acetyltransferase complex protein AlgI
LVFSAPTFLFLFLPGVLLLTALAPVRSRNALLLAASLLFYAWGEMVHVVVMLFSIAFNYAAGRLIGAARDTTLRRLALGLGVGGNLALLALFKYGQFFWENAAGLALSLGIPWPTEPPALLPSHLPIGISFFTFQALSYVVDVYRGDAEVQRSATRLALFIALFPQLIAGPIVRYRRLAPQLANRSVGLGDFAEGARRFTIGLGKKVLIANSLAVPADDIFALPAAELGATVAWFGLACYALQIYFDFSGYSDMAIGVGRMLGFRFPENFDLPYTARSVTEFWRRWHISLSTWFRDYLYIPLGGNRRGAARTYANLLIVFVLCGLWHGASWSFVVWGLFHGAFLVLERAGLGRALAGLKPVWQHLYLLLVVSLAWVFFRTEGLAEAYAYLGALVSLPSSYLIVDFADVETLTILAAGIVGSGRWWRGRLGWLRGGAPLPMAASTAGLAALLIACGMKLADRTYDPFIYFRF